MTHGDEKSDGRVVPAKSSNKSKGPEQLELFAPEALAPAPAEGMEERRPAKGNLRQQNMLRTQGRARMQHALTRVRRAAQRDRRTRFTTLMHHVYNRDTLREAYFGLKRSAAPGVDGQTWRQYGEDLEDNLEDLSGRLRRGAYRAKPVRRVLIPKGDGRMRPLGITALEDKIVQGSVARVFNAIYEVDFCGFSYGFRPGRGQHHALDAVSVAIERGRVKMVLDADVRGFFDAIDHAMLLKAIQLRIADQRIIRLIQKWLRAGVLVDGERTATIRGTPQGGNISPMLANIFLHYVFDLWAHHWRSRRRGNVRIVRYADDFVVGFQYRNDAKEFLADLRERFARCGLELHQHKTRLIEFGRFAELNRGERGLGRPETFTFLGFTHICGRGRSGLFRVERRTDAKRFRQKLKAINQELKRRRHESVTQIGTWLRSVVVGHYRYYGVPLNYQALCRFRWKIGRMWRRAASRRSQNGKVTWARTKRWVDHWLPMPRIMHPHPRERFDVRTQGKSPVR